MSSEASFSIKHETGLHFEMINAGKHCTIITQILRRLKYLCMYTGRIAERTQLHVTYYYYWSQFSSVLSCCQAGFIYSFDSNMFLKKSFSFPLDFRDSLHKVHTIKYYLHYIRKTLFLL